MKHLETRDATPADARARMIHTLKRRLRLIRGLCNGFLGSPAASGGIALHSLSWSMVKATVKLLAMSSQSLSLHSLLILSHFVS